MFKAYNLIDNYDLCVKGVKQIYVEKVEYLTIICTNVCNIGGHLVHHNVNTWYYR